jgi:hypothetical protein
MASIVPSSCDVRHHAPSTAPPTSARRPRNSSFVVADGDVGLAPAAAAELHDTLALGYRGRMASHPARTPLGLFDNPVRVFSLDELAATVRKLEREQPGRTVEELSGAVFTELAIKRTRRAADLVAEAIRLARPRQPGTEITGSQWQASTSEVRNWALSAGFELGADGTIPGPAITAYNQIHPGRPY